MRKLLAIKVHQWLSSWKDVDWNPAEHRRQPEPHFYLFTLPADQLKVLSGVHKRSTEGGLLRSADLRIQRQHDPKRSANIQAFVRSGFPWSDLPASERESPEYADLRKPGWLPTAIVVNILGATDKRDGKKVAPDDLVTVKDVDANTAEIHLPGTKSWTPSGEIPPLEVIDGQHRLWAFDEAPEGGSFDLPVVAFKSLDISWQAYLFYTINIKPKRINPSLAFDLYPLLRTEDWLDKIEGHRIYREARAQELTEGLWSHPSSPWYQKINMLGEPKNPYPSQAAWVRALIATFLRGRDGKGADLGGLFGAKIGENKRVLDWGRSQQLAFLIESWDALRDAVADSNASWAVELRAGPPAKPDPAFYGDHALLNQDQGVRAVLHATNDICYVAAEELNLFDWLTEQSSSALDVQAVKVDITGLRKRPGGRFLKELADGLITFDWRTAAAPSLTEAQKTAKLAFRGSGGYRELRRQVLQAVARGAGNPARHAKAVIREAGLKNA